MVAPYGACLVFMNVAAGRVQRFCAGEKGGRTAVARVARGRWWRALWAGSPHPSCIDPRCIDLPEVPSGAEPFVDLKAVEAPNDARSIGTGAPRTRLCMGPCIDVQFLTSGFCVYERKCGFLKCRRLGRAGVPTLFLHLSVRQYDPVLYILTRLRNKISRCVLCAQVFGVLSCVERFFLVHSLLSNDASKPAGVARTYSCLQPLNLSLCEPKDTPAGSDIMSSFFVRAVIYKYGCYADVPS